MELKRLSSVIKNTPPGADNVHELTRKKLFGIGFYTGLGFWLASTVFFMIILPALACASFVTLSMFGAYITEALGR